MDEKDFSALQQQAIDRMREMNGRAQTNHAPNSMPPVPPFVRVPGQRDTPVRNAETIQPKEPPRTPPQKTASPLSDLLGGLGLPDLGHLGLDGDLPLILGMLLLLWNDHADRRLMLALLYILL